MALTYSDHRVFGLLVALSLAPAARGLVNTRNIEFTRQLDFRRDLFIEIASKSCALAVAITSAAYTHSYWSIAFGTITTPAVCVILSYALNPRMPGFSLKERSVFINYFGWLVGAQAINAINWQFDRLLLARIAPSSVVGRYTLSADLASIPEQTLIKTAFSPFQAAFARAHGDRERLSGMYARAVCGILFVGLPAIVGFSMTAPLSVPLFLGQKWANAAPIVQILSLSLVLPLAYAPLPALILILRETRVYFSRSTAELCIKIPIVLAGLYFYGLFGLVYGRVLSEIVMCGISLSLAKRVISLSIVGLAQAAWRTLAGVLAMAGILIILGSLESLRRLSLPGAVLVLEVVAGGLTYAATTFGLWRLSGSPEGPERQALGFAAKLAARLTLLRSRPATARRKAS